MTLHRETSTVPCAGRSPGRRRRLLLVLLVLLLSLGACRSDRGEQGSSGTPPEPAALELRTRVAAARKLLDQLGEEREAGRSIVPYCALARREFLPDVARAGGAKARRLLRAWKEACEKVPVEP